MWAPDAKYWHRMWSVQLGIISALGFGLMSALPVLGNWAQEHPRLFLATMSVASVVAVLSRLLDQPGIPDR
jgi:hypothetical protein